MFTATERITATAPVLPVNAGVSPVFSKTNYTVTRYALDNKVLRTADPISNLDIFSHGVPGQIRLGYNMEGDEAMTLGKEELAQMGNVANGTFGADPATGAVPLISSYACRTGVTQNGFNLAQNIADQTKATVTAFKRRTNYSGTFTIPGFKVPLQVNLWQCK